MGTRSRWEGGGRGRGRGRGSGSIVIIEVVRSSSRRRFSRDESCEGILRFSRGVLLSSENRVNAERTLRVGGGKEGSLGEGLGLD